MSANVLTINKTNNVRVRGIALPVEHGAWGFLFEPLVAAVVVAASSNAIWISLLVIGAFLMRQPLKILIADLQVKRNLPQTTMAIKFLYVYGAVFAAGFLGSLTFGRIEYFIPFTLIIPFAIFQIYCDASRQSRKLLPEFTGAIAISSSAAAVALAGGWTLPAAIALWGIFVARLIPSILYVRNRLKLEKGKEFQMYPVFAAHFLALGLVGMLAANGLASKLTMVIFVSLLVRAVTGLSPFRSKMKAMKIGIWEVIYGLLTVLSVIIGYYIQF
jgi:YwiC-like protein